MGDTIKPPIRSPAAMDPEPQQATSHRQGQAWQVYPLIKQFIDLKRCWGLGISDMHTARLVKFRVPRSLVQIKHPRVQE